MSMWRRIFLCHEKNNHTSLKTFLAILKTNFSVVSLFFSHWTNHVSCFPDPFQWNHTLQPDELLVLMCYSSLKRRGVGGVAVRVLASNL